MGDGVVYTVRISALFPARYQRTAKFPRIPVHCPVAFFPFFSGQPEPVPPGCQRANQRLGHDLRVLQVTWFSTPSFSLTLFSSIRHRQQVVGVDGWQLSSPGITLDGMSKPDGHYHSRDEGTRDRKSKGQK
jgi:hypothetical protein